MKLNTSIIKTEIVNFIKNNPNCVKNLFDPQDRPQIDETELCNEKVWRRNLKEKTDLGIERYFDCERSKQVALSEQVTCIVITDPTDTKILKIDIEG